MNSICSLFVYLGGPYPVHQVVCRWSYMPQLLVDNYVNECAWLNGNPSLDSLLISQSTLSGDSADILLCVIET